MIPNFENIPDNTAGFGGVPDSRRVFFYSVAGLQSRLPKGFRGTLNVWTVQPLVVGRPGRLELVA
jgi:hypothetical protein